MNVRRDPRHASNLGNLLRRLFLPLGIRSRSLTSLQQRLFSIGGRLIRHARYFILELAESYLTRPLFRQIVARIERLVGTPPDRAADRGRRQWVHIGNSGYIAP